MLLSTFANQLVQVAEGIADDTGTRIGIKKAEVKVATYYYQQF